MDITVAKCSEKIQLNVQRSNELDIFQSLLHAIAAGFLVAMSSIVLGLVIYYLGKKVPFLLIQPILLISVGICQIINELNDVLYGSVDLDENSNPYVHVAYLLEWYLYPVIHWTFIMQYLNTSFTMPRILDNARFKVAIDKFYDNHFNNYSMSTRDNASLAIGM